MRRRPNFKSTYFWVNVCLACGPSFEALTLTQSVDGVEAEADGDEGGGVVERGLHRVHVRAGEGRGVVALVMEAVHLGSSSS